MKYESKELTNDEREKLPGSFIELSHGFTHYEITGIDEDPVVVLIHGFSSPLIVWDNIIESLVQSDFQVLRYDLYGRGYSDRPEVKYNFELFDQQLLELLQKLDLNKGKVSLVGLSMGGGICMTFANKFPELVEKISLFDPVGFPTGLSITTLFLKIPILNKFLLKLVLNHRTLTNRQRPDFFNYDKVDEYLLKFSKQLAYKGYLSAIYSTVLNTNFTNLRSVYEHVATLNIPMQLFWGENDQTIPFKTSEQILQAVPQIQFHPVPNCGHLPQYTHPKEVSPLLITFLKD